MEHLVITVVGDDRAGLVDTLSGAVVRHGGNWERSQMAELAGKFAGVVVVSVDEAKADDLTDELSRIDASGLLHLVVERGAAETGADGTVVLTPTAGQRFTVELVGQDHPGIVHEISHALAEAGVSIDELETEIVPAPMGGQLFKATAALDAPTSLSLDDLQDTLESVAHDLMVDLDLSS